MLVNRHLQSVIQHPSFYKYTSPSATSSSRSTASRLGIVTLLHTLFHQHPNNTCQPSHVTPLPLIYTGTLSLSDIKIFEIFRLYEETRRVPATGLFLRWSYDGEGNDSVLEAIDRLDSTRIFKACLAFPAWRSLDRVSDQPPHIEEQDQSYDPLFVALSTLR